MRGPFALVRACPRAVLCVLSSATRRLVQAASPPP